MLDINFTQKYAAAAVRPAVLVVALGFFGAAGNIKAAPLCYGGSVVRDANNNIVGCAFSNWGSAEQSMCNGATVFSPTNSGPGTCHVCVTQPTAVQVAAGNFSGLTVQPAPPYAPGEPTSFRCLGCTQPPSGLTGWWSLDETNGSYADLTGNLYQNAQAFNGVSSIAGEVGNAARFNGLNQYISIPAIGSPASPIDVAAAPTTPLSTLPGSFSIDAWIKLDNCTTSSPPLSCPSDSGVRVIMEKRTFSANQYKGYSFYLYNQYLGLQLADAGTAPGYSNYGAPALIVPADGKWHLVAVSIFRSVTPASLPGSSLPPTANAFEVQFTLDGASVVLNSPARFGSLANVSNANIGMVTISGGSVFNGSIDEVEFFNRFVMPSEWQSIYSSKCFGKCLVQ